MGSRPISVVVGSRDGIAPYLCWLLLDRTMGSRPISVVVGSRDGIDAFIISNDGVAPCVWFSWIDRWGSCNFLDGSMGLRTSTTVVGSLDGVLQLFPGSSDGVTLPPCFGWMDGSARYYSLLLLYWSATLDH